MKRIVRGVIDVLFPPTCSICGRHLLEGEDPLCLHCLSSLPRVDLHRIPFNEIHHRLAVGKVPIERAGAWFWYKRKSDVTALIFDIKYHYMPRVARRAGQLMAEELIEDGFFDDIEFLVPIPLSRWKRMKRTYNQSEEICRGISLVTGIEVDTGLLRATRGHRSQTRQTIEQRRRNVANTFAVDAEDAKRVRGCHILVVDDIITSGATMNVALQTIHQAAPETQISVLSLGLTRF